MMGLEKIQEDIKASISVKQAMLSHPGLMGQIEGLAEQALQVLRGGGKIIFAGNGGSFADAQHLSAEFISRFMFDRDPLPSIALGTNSSAMSAIGNDYGYDKVFLREILSLGNKGDLFIPISTSGNSNNILLAVDAAIDVDILVTGLTGGQGGKLADKCACIKIPSFDTARIQECHILVGHIVCRYVESYYFAQ